MLTNTINTNQIFNASTNGVLTQNSTTAGTPTPALDLDSLKVGGNFAAEILITGAGTVTVGYLCSNDGVNFIKPCISSALTTALVLASGLTATGGVGSDGEYFIPITNLPVCKYLKLYATETNVGAAAISLTLSMQ